MIFLLTLLFHEALAQGPSCAQPLYAGELRQLGRWWRCLDISGNDGVGSMSYGPCDGGRDQLFTFCADGTLRNAAINFCVTAESKNGEFTGALVSQRCLFNYDDTAHESVKWYMQHLHKKKDKMGIMQTSFSLHPAVNPEYSISRWDSDSESGRIHLIPFENNVMQYWYFNYRGTQLGNGRLVTWNDPFQVVTYKEDWWDNNWCYTYDAETNDLAQTWAHYESGEIVNMKTGLCLEIFEGIEKVRMVPCRYNWQQSWNLKRQMAEGKYFPLVNNYFRSDPLKWKCASPFEIERPELNDVARKHLRALDCNWTKFQYFYWDNDLNWTKPKAEYAMVACIPNGSIQTTVTAATEYTEEMSLGISVEVGMTIAAGCIFEEVEMSASVSTSISNTWSASYSSSTSVAMACTHYDNGDTFTGGCMWRFKLNTVNEDKVLNWKPLIMRCSRGQDPPKCLPFDICLDAECTKCAPKDSVAAEGAPRGLGAPVEAPIKNLESFPKMQAAVTMSIPPKDFDPLDGVDEKHGVDETNPEVHGLDETVSRSKYHNGLVTVGVVEDSNIDLKAMAFAGGLAVLVLSAGVILHYKRKKTANEEARPLINA